MSVLSLTQKEFLENENTADGCTPYNSGTTERLPDDSSDKFDKIFEAAWAKVEPQIEANENPQPSGKSLDEIISENLDRAEAKQHEAADFDASRESRDRLAARYGHIDGSSLSKTVDLFVNAVQELKQNPQGAAQRIAASYLAASPYALQENDGLSNIKREEAKFHDADWRTRDHRKSNDKLDELISDAIENSGREKAEFKETEAQRAALKEIFPHLSFSQALEKIVKIDADLHREPLVTAAVLGAQFGMPVLPAQHEAKAHLDQMQNVVDGAASHLPGLQHAEVQGVVAEILRRPDFVRTNNPQADLQRAYGVAAHLAQQSDRLGQWAEGEIAKMPPALGQMVEHTLLNDQTYKARAAQNLAAAPFGDETAPRINFGLAVGIAEAKLAALSKAKRAERAATSSGVGPRGGTNRDGGLDAVISQALSGWGD